jgi:pyruvate/2-oxoglutarate dehydrogenase complex dihydrolipoamide dehydrogenase (E3) component/pimeloyl-ACP methyl ester carboxylesterase
MTTENYKNIIIGSGEGGKFLAWHLAKAGEKTAVVERRWVGGSCPNVNCLPSKNEIWSAKVANLVFHAAKFGSMTTPGPVDMSVVRRRKREMVDGLVAMHLEKYKASGAELIMGEAKFTGPKTIEVRLSDGGNRTLTAERIFLNLGTHASIPRIPGLAESAPLTNIETLELDRLPEHLIVIGGGYVGLEFAQAYRRFGSKVTVVQQGPQLLSEEDPDVAAEIVQAFLSEGIDVLAPTEILKVEGQSGQSVSLTHRTPSGETTITGSDILVATGRTPNTTGISLELAGVQLDERGYIRVNDRLETAAPNIWAIGECAGSPKFTHVSQDDFRIIRDNLAGGRRSTRDRVIPSCLFTDPQVAHIGLSETEARRRNIPVRIAKIPMAVVLRTQTIDETRGFMKAFLGADDRILGFTMVGPEAGEVLAVVQTAMLAGLRFPVLRDAILTHPTMAEGLNALFASVKPATAATIAPSVGLSQPRDQKAPPAVPGQDVTAAPSPRIATRRVEADGVSVFYREAGPPNAPVVLLLHGFPASSFQFRELIPRLADRYRVIAPDLPGFGFTEVPSRRKYEYSFDNLAQTIIAFTDALGLRRYALYVFDYGAPTGFRLAMARPDCVTAIISQNGNAYEEGLGDAWAPIQRYWSEPTLENRETLRRALTPEGIRREYSQGMSNPDLISPEGYTLDASLIAQPGRTEIQLDLFLDYANNVRLYPAFHQYFRRSKPPLLAIWGKHDPYFIPAGAEAFRRDNPNATVQFLDTGHFALETHVDEISRAMRQFLAKSVGLSQAATA